MLFRLDTHSKRRFESRTILRHHERDVEFVETLRHHRQTNQTAAEPRHKVDCLGGDLFRRHGQIAHVFSIFVIGDDYHLARTYRRDCCLNLRELVRRVTG